MREFTQAERQVKRENAMRLNLARHLVTGYHGPRWTEAELALLGTLPDAEVARQIGKTVEAVRVMRTKLGLPRPGMVGGGSDGACPGMPWLCSDSLCPPAPSP